MSLLTDCPHISSSRPLFVFAWDGHSSVILGSELHGLQQPCDSHRMRRAWDVATTVHLQRPVLFLRSSMEMVFGQKILRMRRGHFVWETSSCFQKVVLKCYAPYRKTPRTLLLKILLLVEMLKPAVFQTGFSMANA